LSVEDQLAGITLRLEKEEGRMNLRERITDAERWDD
jgi:hypothetical protein